MTRRPRRSWPVRLLSIFARTLAGAFLAVVLLAVGAAVWVHRNLTPERLRPVIISQLERTFKRHVEIDGVGVVLDQGVRVTGLKVFSRAGSPEDVFLAADLMIVRYSFPALLQGRFVLTTVRLVNPRLSLYRRPDGDWNVADMLGGPEARPPAGRWALPPLSVAVRTTLEGGTVRLVDAKRGVEMKVHDVGMTLTDFGLDRPFPCKLSFVNDALFLGRSHELKLTADLELTLGGLALDKAAVYVQRMKATLDGRPVEGSGRLRGLRLPEFEAKLTVPPLASEDLRGWGFARAPEGLHVPASSWELRGHAVAAPAVAKSTAPPVAGAFFISRLAGAGGPWRVEAAGRVGVQDGAVSGTLRTRGVALEKVGELYARWGEYGLAGNLDAALSLGGTLAAPKVTQWALDLRGFSWSFWNGKRFSDTDATIRAGEHFRDAAIRVTKGTYVAYSNALTGLDADVHFSSSDLAVSRLGLTWNGSRFSLKGCVRDIHTWRKVAVEAEVDKLRVDESYRAIENLISQRLAELGKAPQQGGAWAETFRGGIPDRFPDMVGRLRVLDLSSPNFEAQNLDLVWGLKDIARGLQTVSGHFQAGFGPGSLRNITDLQKSHPLVNVLLIPYVEMHKIRQKSRGSFETAIPTGLDFTRMFGDFSANGAGLVGVNFIHFDSRPFQAFTAGTADFPKSAVDLNVLMRMTEPAQNLPFYMVDDDGRLALDVSLVKDLNKPEVVFRNRKVGSHDIEKGLEEGLKRVSPLPDVAAAVACKEGG